MPEKPTADVILRDKALKNVERRHPWIFSGAVQSVQGEPEGGDLVRVLMSNGKPIGLGYWNAESEICVRIFAWDTHTVIDEDFWWDRMEDAITRRVPMKNATRLINAENDYLPGLIVDKYGDWLVLQALSLGVERRKYEFAQILADMLHPRGIYERSDVEIRDKEGLDDAEGVLWGEAPPDTVEIEENGHKLLVDIYEGHKTGFYLDQQENRLQLREFLRQQPHAAEMTVLNAFCFTGGFSVAAHAGGADKVLSVDTSAPALDLARKNVALNGFAVNEEDFIEENVSVLLRNYRDANRQFDLIILDPPKFARHASQIENASRGYKDINWLAFRLLKPGGYLWTFSCSNAIDADLFQKIVFGAMLDAGRDAQIVGRMGAASDHPVALTYPEGAYLKGLICRVE